MRRSVLRWTLPALLFALICGCAAGRDAAAPAVDQAAIAAAADSVGSAFSAAIAAADTAGVVALYAADALLLPPNAMRATGSDGIRQVWAGYLAMPGLTIKLSSTDKLVSEDGSLVVDIGSYELDAKDVRGGLVHDVGKYMTVLKKVNGEWKIVADTWNTDSPMPPM